MNVSILYKSKDNFPSINDLIRTMYKKGISFSKAGDAATLKNCTTLALSWDKWVDDKRWEHHSKFKEYIYFELSKTADGKYHKISIQIDDRATFVDQRAFFKVIKYIIKKTQGVIDTCQPPQDLIKETERYDQYSFEDAIEISLREN